MRVCRWVGGTGVWSRKEKGMRSRHGKTKLGEAQNRIWSTEIIIGEWVVHSLWVEPGSEGESCAEEQGIFPWHREACVRGKIRGDWYVNLEALYTFLTQWVFLFDFSRLFPKYLFTSLLGKTPSAEFSSVAQNPWASSWSFRFVEEKIQWARRGQ